jgi:1,4-dihydroxy-2-naphthoyl-CoA hydrolase
MDHNLVNDNALAEARSPFGRWLGTKLTHISRDRVSAQLVVREELLNTNGVLSGGAMMALADNLGGTATILNLPAGARTATIESKTNFFASCPLGETIVTETTPLHRGRSTMVWQTTITRSDGKVAAIVTQTQIVMAEKR